MKRRMTKVITLTLSASMLATTLTGCNLPIIGKKNVSGNETPAQEDEIKKIDVSQYVDEDSVTYREIHVTPIEDTVEENAVEAPPEGAVPFDLAADAPTIMANAFYPNLRLSATVTGGQFEVGVSGPDEYMKLTTPDNKVTQFYEVGGTMYIYETDGGEEGSVVTNYKITDADFNADPNTEMSETDFLSNLASTGDPSKYGNAEKLPEADIDGITYLPITTTDSDGQVTTFYISEDTGKCIYMDVPTTTMKGNSEFTRFTVEEGSPVTEQPWMTGASTADANTFISSMLAFIFSVFAGDTAMNYGS